MQVIFEGKLSAIKEAQRQLKGAHIAAQVLMPNACSAGT